MSDRPAGLCCAWPLPQLSSISGLTACNLHDSKASDAPFTHARDFGVAALNSTAAKVSVPPAHQDKSRPGVGAREWEWEKVRLHKNEEASACLRMISSW